MSFISIIGYLYPIKSFLKLLNTQSCFSQDVNQNTTNTVVRIDRENINKFFSNPK